MQAAKSLLRWDVVVLSLQQVMHKPLHVGGRTAAELSGYAHYLEAGDAAKVYLYGQGIPSWLAKLPSSVPFETRSTRLFANSSTGIEMKRYDLRSGKAAGPYEGYGFNESVGMVFDDVAAGASNPGDDG